MTSFKELCDTFHFDSPAQFEALKTWCLLHVSSDIDDTGPESQDNYLALARHYLDDFLANLPPPRAENIPLFNEQTVIQYAAQQGYDHYLNQLSNIAPDALNHKTIHGITPLDMAACKGNLHAVQALLKLGANAASLDKDLQTPLFSSLLLADKKNLALKLRKELIFNALVQAGTMPLSHQDVSGETVFHLMAAHGFTELLIKYTQNDPSGLFISNNFAKYPIHTAILNNQPELVAYLLKIPSMPSVTDSRKQCALHCAAKYGSKEMLLLCLKATPDLNVTDGEGKTALTLAIEMNNQEAIEVLS